MKATSGRLIEPEPARRIVASRCATPVASWRWRAAGCIAFDPRAALFGRSCCCSCSILGLGAFGFAHLSDVNHASEVIRNHWLRDTGILGRSCPTTCPTTAPPRPTVCSPRPPRRRRRARRISRRLRDTVAASQRAYEQIPQDPAEAQLYAQFAQQWAAYQRSPTACSRSPARRRERAGDRAVQDRFAPGIRSVERHAEPADRSDPRQGAPRQRPRRVDLRARADHVRDRHAARGVLAARGHRLHVRGDPRAAREARGGACGALADHDTDYRDPERRARRRDRRDGARRRRVPRQCGRA